MSTEGRKELPNDTLTSVIAAKEYPTEEVSRLAEATRAIGAAHMMAHLAEGDWCPSNRARMGELLSRIIANAARQNVAIDPPTTEI